MGEWPPKALEAAKRLQELQKELTTRYGDLVATFSLILFRHDPVGINFETNADEYDAEATTILARMPHATTVGDVERVVTEELESWFSPADFDRMRVPALAAELWRAWNERPAQDK